MRTRLTAIFPLALIFLSIFFLQATAQSAQKPRFKVLVLSENGGHHIKYSEAAKIWLDKLATDNHFAIDYIQNTETIDETSLNQYQLFIQLDYPPYGWSEKAVNAFQDYMKNGKGGWIGFHHATLLGEFDGYPMWDWFSNFMGGIRYQNYIATFVTATVKVEDTGHPIMKGIPASFVIEKEEWYTYDKSPRKAVHTLASVDESTYVPNSTIKMGDHPVIWSNPSFPTRNVYIFMGHSPDLFNNAVYMRLFKNTLFWAAGEKPE